MNKNIIKYGLIFYSFIMILSILNWQYYLMQESEHIIFENVIFERCGVTMKINNKLYDEANFLIMYKNNNINTDIYILNNLNLWQFSDNVEICYLIIKNDFIKTEIVDCYLYDKNNNKINFKLFLSYNEEFLYNRYKEIPALARMNEIEFILRPPFIKENGKCTNRVLITNENLMFIYNDLSKIHRAFYWVTNDKKYSQVFYFEKSVNLTRQILYNIDNNIILQYYKKSILFLYYSIALILKKN